MRILFNHGLTPADIYINTPKKVIDRPWRWFIRRYGSTSSFGDAISDPFKYCFALVLNRILDEKARFIIPTAIRSYIDFEIVTGDDFVKHRQNGRFQNIDFVESDFTGYALKYYYEGKSYQKTLPIYLGGELKQKFLNKINDGVNYYTIKDLTIHDFIDDVHKKFKDISKAEIKSLLVHGFRRMHFGIKFGCAVTINTTKFLNCYAYIGEIHPSNPGKQIEMYSRKKDRKLRKMAIWNKNTFDGYYYIGLTEKTIKHWANLNKTARTIVKFERVLLRKIQEELYYKAPHVFIFQVPAKKFNGWTDWIEGDIKFRDVVYMGEAIERKFFPAKKTWKDLVKEYETK